MKRSLFVLLTTAFLLRLVALNQSLWLDEGTTARVIKEYSYWGIITQFSPFDFHPPLYYLFMKLWSSVCGYSEAALRLPSVIFSVLTGWVVYKIVMVTRRVLPAQNDKTALWAVALFLFNPLIMYYSQEARMYMMVTFLLSIAIYYFIRLLIVDIDAYPGKSQKLKVKNQNNEIRNLVIFNLAIFLSFFTFYGSIFLILTFYIYLIYKRDFKLLIKLLPGFILSVIFISPLLYQQWQHSRESLAFVLNWRAVLGPVSLKNLMLIPLKFVTGRLSFDPKKLYYFLGGIVSFLSLIAVWLGGWKNIALLFLLVTPLLLGVLFSFFTPLLQYFRFLYLLPLFCILISLGLKQNWQRLPLLLGFISFSLLYLFCPQFHREDWRSAAQYVSRENKPLYMISSSADALRYYSSANVHEIRNLSGVQNIEKDIFVVPYTTEIYGYDYKTALHKMSFQLIKTRSFRGIVLERWSLRR